MWYPTLIVYHHFLHWNAILVVCSFSNRPTSRGAETVGAPFRHTRRGSSTSQSPPDSPHAGPSRVLCHQEKPRSAWKGTVGGSSWIKYPRCMDRNIPRPWPPPVVHIRRFSKWMSIPFKKCIFRSWSLATTVDIDWIFGSDRFSFNFCGPWRHIGSQTSGAGSANICHMLTPDSQACINPFCVLLCLNIGNSLFTSSNE